jgi:hypothetical protein
MGRPSTFKKSVVISTRFEEDDYRQMQEIAALETSYSGRQITAQDLIRNACVFCYQDGERLREVFRRMREHVARRFPK